MKSSKLFGALTLSAALAMGTAAPAFAAAGDVGTEGAFKKETATTDVNMIYNTTQINCTIPLDLTIGVQGPGMKAVVAPDASKYAINNSGDATIKVSSIKTENSNASWVLNEVTASTTDAQVATAEGWLDMELSANGSTVDLVTAKTTPQTPGSGFQVASGKALELELSGNSFTKSTTTAANDTYTPAVFQIIYTIAEA